MSEPRTLGDLLLEVQRNAGTLPHTPIAPRLSHDFAYVGPRADAPSLAALGDHELLGAVKTGGVGAIAEARRRLAARSNPEPLRRRIEQWRDAEWLETEVADALLSP